MNYWLSAFVNFFSVFVMIRYAPGLAAAYTETSSIGSDLLFSAALAFFNASVFPLLILVEIFPDKLKLAALTGIISFGGFTLLAIIPYGFHPDVGGVVIGGALTWLISFLTNFFEMRHWIEKHKN